MTSIEQPLTVVVEPSEPGLASLLDDATAQILELEARGYQPRALTVPATQYQLIADTKHRDLERDLPLIVLGLPLIATE